MRVVILNCTNRKRRDPQGIPALFRYDDGAWKMLRRFYETATAEQLYRMNPYVISGRYGMQPADFTTFNYDEKIRATPELGAQVAISIDRIFALKPKEVFFHLTRPYLDIVEDFFPMYTKIRMLHCWLNAIAYTPIEPPQRIEGSDPPKDKVVLAGITIPYTKETLTERAAHILETSPSHTAFKFKTWFVRIRQHRVSVDWLARVAVDGRPFKRELYAVRRAILNLGFTIEHAPSRFDPPELGSNDK